VERAGLLAQGELVRTGDLGLRAGGTASAPALEEMTLDEMERLLIQKALTRYEGNVSQAAKALGLSRSALYRRLAAHGL
jgi:transcriptional regulator of acetoin/glycerol metabolism